MIFVSLGQEPISLSSVRVSQLRTLAKLGRNPKSDEIHGYRVVAEELWRRQHFKCCYCESKVRFKFNDVEHYRPKAYADRLPGCNLTHGYWWLAYTWGNLIYACSTCNRANKNARFPLAKGSVSLRYDRAAPGDELPLLLNPAEKENPVEHIKFVFERGMGKNSREQWWARPRDGSVKGSFTIEICGLNDFDLLELRDEYVKDILKEKVDDLRSALDAGSPDHIKRAHERAMSLLRPTLPHVGLAFDVFTQSIPQALLGSKIALRWPEPTEVGL